MPRNDDEEFAALTKVVQALAPLAPDQQRRVLDYAVARFGTSQPAPKPETES